jgi:hypothetical protein
MRFARFAILALMLATPFRANAAPPVGEFTAIPKYDNLAISPGGTRLLRSTRQASLLISDSRR